MEIQPYLFFEGRCEEAVNFYRDALGAEVTAMMRFKDSPEPPNPDMCAGGGPVNIDGDKVMHASFRIGKTEVMASDGMANGQPKFEGFSLSISARDEAEADRLFKALADGGNVVMPLGQTFFSPCFGMVADRFGVHWMVVTVPEEASA